MRFSKLIALVFLFIGVHSALAVDLDQIQKLLTTTGAEGWIHGSVESQSLFVFTYRNPTNFFDYVEMSLVWPNAAIQKQLATFDRHDKVRVKGDFMTDNPSPQKHIMISSVELITKYDQPYPTTPYQHQVKIPDDLMGKTTETFLVHAVAGDGQILVVEYKDVILPIFVHNGALAKTLYRGDLVQLQFKIRGNPTEPVHLSLNEMAPQPIQVLQAIKDKHGKPAAVEGALIMFPKSPEINFNVFAVKEELPSGSNRQYTIANMEDPDLFAKLRAKLQAAWDKYPGAFVNGRNKLVSTRLRVKVTGTFNEVDPSQANAQILITSLDQVQVIEQ